MTKKELSAKRDKILKTNSAIIDEMEEPWEIAHQNAVALYELNKVINEYLEKS